MNASTDAQSTMDLVYWLWAFPLSYLIHAAEEYFGGEGYIAYLKRLRGITIPTSRFIVLHFVGFALMTAGVVLSQVFTCTPFMLGMLGGLSFSNGMSHTATAIWDRRYGPGLITSILWIPLGITAVVEAFGHTSDTNLAIAISIGIGINIGVALITLRGGRIRKTHSA